MVRQLIRCWIKGEMHGAGTEEGRCDPKNRASSLLKFGLRNSIFRWPGILLEFENIGFEEGAKLRGARSRKGFSTRREPITLELIHAFLHAFFFLIFSDKTLWWSWNPCWQELHTFFISWNICSHWSSRCRLPLWHQMYQLTLSIPNSRVRIGCRDNALHTDKNLPLPGCSSDHVQYSGWTDGVFFHYRAVQVCTGVTTCSMPRVLYDGGWLSCLL